MDETLRLFQFFILKGLQEPAALAPIRSGLGEAVLPVGRSASRRARGATRL